MIDNNLDNSDAPERTRTLRPSLTPELGRQIGRFKERLKIITEKESLRGFGRKAGISEGALRHYLNGDSYPDLDRLAAIAEQANVSLLWLATGEGAMSPASPDASMHCVDVELLRKAVEAVEMMGRNAPVERKALAIARVYERLVISQGDMELFEGMRLIQAILADTPYI
jgi:transcriptional regulator with XRE-family HTH domain